MTRISLSQRCRVPASFLSPCTPKRKSRSKGETHISFREVHKKRKGGVRAGCPHSQRACTHILLYAAFLVQSSPQTRSALARLGLEVGRNQAAELLAQQTQRLQDTIHLRPSCSLCHWSTLSSSCHCFLFAEKLQDCMRANFNSACLEPWPKVLWRKSRTKRAGWQLDDRCWRYQGAWCWQLNATAHIHSYFFFFSFSVKPDPLKWPIGT